MMYAALPTGRGQRSSCFVASVERGPVHANPTFFWIIAMSGMALALGQWLA